MSEGAYGSHTGWPRQGCVTPGNEPLDRPVRLGWLNRQDVVSPGLGQAGLHGAGYWVGVAFWRDQAWTITDYSQVVYLNR